MVFVLALLATLGALASPQCSVLPQGYYSSPTHYVHGAPPPSNLKLVLQPDFLTCQEVEQLNAHCVKQINQFRAGELRFTGGLEDFRLGQLLPLRDASNNARCQAEAALGDFALTGLNNCSAIKTPVNMCGAMAGIWRQSTCCPRNAGGTYASVQLALDSCLQEHFDQGLATDVEGARTADWLNIKSPTSVYASCGFAFGKTPSGDNVVLMTHNYASRYSLQADSATEAPAIVITTSPNVISSSSDDAMCGNGVVESGEECDCGNECALDKCCVAATCKLAADAECSAMDACCDSDTCSVKKTSQVCRASVGGCDPVEICNGKSSKCPQDVRIAAGTSCGATGQDKCSPCGECVTTMHKQCNAFRTRLVRTCDWLPTTDMCESMYCTDGLDNLACWGRVTPQLGTFCGQGKFCSEGQCVSEAQVVCPQLTRSPTMAAVTLSPSQSPSVPPTLLPTLVPTAMPTKSPSARPTPQPSKSPTNQPTRAPTKLPTSAPTKRPTNAPTFRPSKLPTTKPTRKPTKAPTKQPTKPTKRPTLSPSTKPTLSPTFKPTLLPTAGPSGSPTLRPSAAPSRLPTLQPTLLPTVQPTPEPSSPPTLPPTFTPTKLPTFAPTKRPTSAPSSSPVFETHTSLPSVSPTFLRTSLPTTLPTSQPTLSPTTLPTTGTPTVEPTHASTAPPTIVAPMDTRSTGSPTNTRTTKTPAV